MTKISIIRPWPNQRYPIAYPHGPIMGHLPLLLLRTIVVAVGQCKQFPNIFWIHTLNSEKSPISCPSKWDMGCVLWGNLIKWTIPNCIMKYIGLYLSVPTVSALGINPVTQSHSYSMLSLILCLCTVYIWIVLVPSVCWELYNHRVSSSLLGEKYYTDTISHIQTENRDAYSKWFRGSS